MISFESQWSWGIIERNILSYLGEQKYKQVEFAIKVLYDMFSAKLTPREWREELVWYEMVIENLEKIQGTHKDSVFKDKSCI